jgi:hypothetical protein
MPCGDKDGCNEVKQEQTSHDGHEKTDELCSPFCFCNCCATHFIIKDYHVIFNELPETQNLPIAFIEAHHDGAISAIWQPPKVS